MMEQMRQDEAELIAALEGDERFKAVLEYCVRCEAILEHQLIEHHNDRDTDMLFKGQLKVLRAMRELIDDAKEISQGGEK